jgi:iron(III) transport system substrate-binding protein
MTVTRWFRSQIFLVALGLTGLLPSACGSDADLVVYSGRSETLVQPLIDRFQDETGLEVVVKYGGTAELAATLLEERGNTPADVYYAQDPGGLGAIESMLTPVSDDIRAAVPAWAASPEGLWVGISGRARVLVHDPSRVNAEELPDDIWDLTDPKWKGRIGWAPTNGSFLTMVTGMRALWGEVKTRNWLEGIVANEPKIYPKNTPQVAAVASGEIDVGMPNHYYLYRFLAEEGESFPARNYHFRVGGPGALVMVSGAGVLDASDNKDTANQFIDFLLSDRSQQYFADETFEYPVVEGIAVNGLLVPMDQIVRPDITLAELTDLAGTTELLREAGALP